MGFGRTGERSENAPRVVRRGDLEPQRLDDLTHRAHLRRVGFGELARPEPKAVFQADADVPAHRRRHRRDRKLIASGAEHAPAVLIAEEPIRGALHVGDVVGMRSDAAEDPEHALDEQRRLDHTALQEMRGRVQVADVVALDLEASPVVGTRGEDVLDVLERVLEDAVLRSRKVRPLPIELERREALEHRIEPEVHRAHVERRDLGLQLQRRLQTLLDRHRRRATGGEIDDDVATPRDVGGELAKVFRVLRRMPVDRIARMQMDDGGTRLPRADVWIEPVTAQVMMTLRVWLTSPPCMVMQNHGRASAPGASASLRRIGLLSFVRSERHQPAIAPARARVDLGGVRRLAKRRTDLRRICGVLLSHQVDRERGEVRATLAGLAEKGCPVSKVLKCEITLDAALG